MQFNPEENQNSTTATPELTKEVIGQGDYLRLVKVNDYEYAERIKGSGVVAMIPVTEAGEVILIKQYRRPLDRVGIDLPAGLVGDHSSANEESFATAARRELVEECGYLAHSLTELFERPTSAGLTDETIVYYLATDLEKVSNGGGVADEQIEVFKVPFVEVDAWLKAREAEGFMVDSKVDVGLRYLQKFFADKSANRKHTNLLEALPANHRPFTDKYFLRTNEVLKEEGVNPFIRAQIFVRKGPGTAHGIDEALAVLERYSKIAENGGRVYALPEGVGYAPKDTLILIEARAQDIMELETMYLGVLSAETTKANGGPEHVNLDQVRENMRAIRELVGDRPVIYMGARHWTFREDALISRAAIEGGATMASTDIGAAFAGQEGVGTIPHALENIYAWLKGKENAVKEATLAFDRVMDPSVPRVALIDYNNREIDDSLATARALEGRLTAVRVDTCGENLAQGAYTSLSALPADHILADALKNVPVEDQKFWFGTGVTVSGVYALRKALDDAGFQDVKMVLSSGFAEVAKVQAFIRAEEALGIRLFDTLGVGGLYKPCREAKMDIVAVADSLEELDRSPISKVGREYRPNSNLELVLGSK